MGGMTRGKCTKESKIVFPKKSFFASTHPMRIPGIKINNVDSIPIFILKKSALYSKGVNLSSIYFIDSKP